MAGVPWMSGSDALLGVECITKGDCTVYPLGQYMTYRPMYGNADSFSVPMTTLHQVDMGGDGEDNTPEEDPTCLMIQHELTSELTEALLAAGIVTRVAAPGALGRVIGPSRRDKGASSSCSPVSAPMHDPYEGMPGLVEEDQEAGNPLIGAAGESILCDDEALPL